MSIEHWSLYFLKAKNPFESDIDIDVDDAFEFSENEPGRNQSHLAKAHAKAKAMPLSNAMGSSSFKQVREIGKH